MDPTMVMATVGDENDAEAEPVLVEHEPGNEPGAFALPLSSGGARG